jgi:hypothetical protein
METNMNIERYGRFEFVSLPHNTDLGLLIKRYPWAVSFNAVEGGILCFESKLGRYHWYQDKSPKIW